MFTPLRVGIEAKTKAKQNAPNEGTTKRCTLFHRFKTQPMGKSDREKRRGGERLKSSRPFQSF